MLGQVSFTHCWWRATDCSAATQSARCDEIWCVVPAPIAALQLRVWDINTFDELGSCKVNDSILCALVHCKAHLYVATYTAVEVCLCLFTGVDFSQCRSRSWTLTHLSVCAV